MLATLVSLATRLAAIRWAVKSLVGLGALIPVAFALKVVGLPILAVLGVLALPVMFVLFVLGLPVFLVVIAAALLMAGLYGVMTIGLFAIKILVFVVLPVWLAWLAVSYFWRLAHRAPSPVVGTASGAVS